MVTAVTMTETVTEAVEADAFLQIYEAIEDSSRKIQVPVRHPCALRKVVWSSFDYMTGPELGFTWEAVTSINESALSGKSSLSDGSHDDSSLTSSMTKGGGSAADYEEIDDVYRNKLLTETVSDMQVCSTCICAHTDVDTICSHCNHTSELPHNNFNMIMCGDERLYLGEFMTESRSTIDGTTTLTGGDNDHASLTSLSRSGDLESSANSDKDDLTPFKMNLSSSSQAEEVADMNCLNGVGELLLHSEISAKNGDAFQGMVSSGIDSGIVGTISIHSELSTAASSSHTKETLNVKLNEVTRESCFPATTENYVEKVETALCDGHTDYEALCDLIGDSVTVHLSDEEYVAKFVLSEQICSTPMPSNPIIHKLTLLPKRHLFVGSYLFQSNGGARRDRSMCAISLLGDYSKWEWYTERQNVIEEAFVDIIPRLRISYLTESIEDFICRATKEISKLMSFLGIRQTYFGDEKLQDNSFLAKAITAVLLSQSHCVIVGDRKVDVVKIELISVMGAGAESHWPLTIIDLDRRTVCTSSPHPKHHTLKLRKQKNDITQILKGSAFDLRDSIMPKIELRNCHADPRVTNFLVRMDLLPFEKSARLGFIRQFRLLIENSARALIAYVQDISEPDSSYKQHTTSSRWTLWPARKSLDLVNSTSFLVTLSEAERILPEIADFICESSALG
uniref:Folliculin n=1 Tax=Setaria digitata TaxID=48799 RepID=A0A915PIP6_9BILA